MFATCGLTPDERHRGSLAIFFGLRGYLDGVGAVLMMTAAVRGPLRWTKPHDDLLTRLWHVKRTYLPLLLDVLSTSRALSSALCL